MPIGKTNIIEKRNVLNEIRCNNMHLQELRFFTIYLSKINARDPDGTRRVRFPLSDFLAIMELSKANIADLKRTTNNLLCKIVNVPTGHGGYTAFQLFKECTVDKDNSNGIWYIEIDAHDKALPLMFEFKRDYFTYELWNALQLTSSNQLRMYEILKQYQQKRERVIELEKLKELLYINKNEYPRFGDFKIWVLNACQKALKENTDICFDYELIKKAKGKVHAIKFLIYTNKEYKSKMALEKFIELNTPNNVCEHDFDAEDKTEEDMPEEDPWERNLKFFSEALNDEFTLEQVEVLYKLSVPHIATKDRKHPHGFDTAMYDYLALKLAEMNAAKNVKHRYNYLKKLIALDVTL